MVLVATAQPAHGNRLQFGQGTKAKTPTLVKSALGPLMIPKGQNPGFISLQKSGIFQHTVPLNTKLGHTYRRNSNTGDLCGTLVSF